MGNKSIEVLNFEDLLNDDVEIIEIDDYDIEIVEVEDDISFDLPVLDKKINKGFLGKIRERLNSHKFAIVTTCTFTLIVTLTSVFLLRSNVSNNTVSSQSNVVYSSSIDNAQFKLLNEDYNQIPVNGVYEEKGAQLIIDGVDYSSEVVIDSSNVNTSVPGIYHVVYTYYSNINQVRTLYRTINVVDEEVPVIKLLGSKVYTMLVNEQYDEAGFIVNDNSSEDLTENVVIENNVDNSKPGIYSIKYSVSDSSGNVSYDYRTVVVKYSYSSNSNSVLTNKFTDNGIFLTGLVNTSGFNYQAIMKNKDTGDESIIDLVSSGYNYYQMNLDVTNFSNGVYEFYLVSNSLDPMVSNLACYSRIVRAHIGNKLVTMSYDKNIVNMKIEDFSYLYDVVIDPGHGGADFGATNGSYWEKSINLELSLYEKKRFEDHGLRVFLLRDTDENYGIVMGDDSRDIVEQKAYAVGYYGSVSKIVYSNHHNSSTNTGSAGWEILVPAGASYNDLGVEHSIADEWSKLYYGINEPYSRFYTRNYEDSKASNKANGEVYDFMDYYAVIRVPNQLFGVQNILYEGAYINNSSDMYWYYNLENYKKLSEIKIKKYVESIGVKYIEP